ncbi:MAG: NAD(P)/FAD-dependent oxidoreductase [Candidatus Marinimicrobia bacterium]|nr:NAD(P)/FAD-dependent oxidoreductase [Candidatus Neomarinimicrobiota bacterium]MCF7840344.1 NAD(P)/FAD-dependent oxidoreductase [Candidatus Neomarinimicrobiota bacterium]MCF7902408.1 NAD(P)/FAD-dependent oxidoreductase [Candidatus Neomarinimicrobiota bacterium]
MKKVIIVGGGFAGLNAAKVLGNQKGFQVTLIDSRNHHLFQPLLYQVAMAGLSPAEIARPIREMLGKYRNVRVLQGMVQSVKPDQRKVVTDFGEKDYDYLVLAGGAKHTYFGHSEWEVHAPGLKTIEQATEIRRRVLMAFEKAEREDDPADQKKHLTFVIVGGGPTGVELAGAIGEMSRFTIAREFRQIDPKLTRVILIEAGPRILPSFSKESASKATRDLEKLGVQVWTSSMVTGVNHDGVEVGEERVRAATVLWAAGVKASHLNGDLNEPKDQSGRVQVEPDLSVKSHPEIFVCGDQAAVIPKEGEKPLPGLAPVALQQGRYVAKMLIRKEKGRPVEPFSYRDKGQLATIGRSRAVAEFGKIRISGFFAWLAWLLVHIYYLTGFKNRLFVVIQWAWAYLTFDRGARLIVGKDWQFYAEPARPTVANRSDKITAQ